MPRANAVEVRNSFLKGLFTEATGLSFPEDASTDTDNCVFGRTGIVSRRLGIDLEDHFSRFAKDVSSSAIATYVWKNVAGQGDLNYVVSQVGNALYFYKVVSGSALSAGKHASTIDLTTYLPSGISTVQTIECQFSAGNGLLFVTHPNLESFYVTYSVAGDTFTGTQLTIKIRDFEGDTTDALVIDNRPATNVAGLSAAHHYNLLNQGWTTTNLTAWDTARADMPSNSDVQWYYKNSSDAFDFSIVDNTFVGNSPAAKGHFTYSIYNVKRSDNQSGANDSVISSGDRVSTSAFYRGRVFYAGLAASQQNSKIYFTRIVENASQYGQCYQDNDPTSEQLFALLPSDGGVINLIEAGTIVKMMPVFSALLVFCTNGVWMISGSANSGFQANDYVVSKISSIQTLTSKSFVDIEGAPYWWNLEGIYTVKLDQSGNPIVTSVTDSAIKSYYSDIPIQSKNFARGAYDPFSKTVQWIFRSTDVNVFADNYVFDRVLNLNMITGAFFPWSIDTTNVRINSIVDILSVGGNFAQQLIVDGATQVVDSGVNLVAFIPATTEVSNSTVKFFCSYSADSTAYLSFAETYQDSYLDFESYSTGQSYVSYFFTGYSIKGQALKKFQDNYINAFLTGDDQSFKVLGVFDFAINGNTGRWGSSQTFTSSTAGYDYKPLKFKLRGTGEVIQMKIYNNGEDPFFLAGWSTFLTGNQWI